MGKNILYLLVLLLLFSGPELLAQINHPGTGTVNQTVVCGTTIDYYDSGGPAANYFSNESGTVIFCPDTPGEMISIRFSVVDIETSAATCFDFLTIADDNGTIVEGCGEASGDGDTAGPAADNIVPGDSFTSSAANGCLSIFFDSDGSVSEAGWIAEVSCGVLPPAITFNHPQTGTVNQTVACGTTIDYYDSGGPAANYFSNESGTVIFCPDTPGEMVNISFSVVDIETSAAACFDFLTISDDNGTIVEGCGEVSGDGNTAGPAADNIAPGDSFTSSAANGCLTIFFDSDGSVSETGWIAEVSCSDGMTPCTGETDPPMVACNNTTITFSGEATIPIDVEMVLYDASNSMDACGGVTFLGPMAFEVSCSDVGTIVPVLVEAIDDNGNTGSCTAEITVNGLPCSWIDSGGIGCAGSAVFNAVTGSFMVSGTDCEAVFPYTADQTGFIYQELCADSEIIAEVTGMTGSGFGGVMMRESLAPGAKKITIGTNTVSRIRRDYRVLDNYPAFPQEVVSYDKFWVRLQRIGNSFKGYASTNGTNWVPFIFQNIQMSNCILVGLYTYGKGNGAAATGSFENVQITSAMPVMLGQNNDTTQGSSVFTTSNVQLFPNPTANELNIQMADFMDQEVEIQVFNSVGQLVDRTHIERLQQQVFQVDVSNWSGGLYLVKVKTKYTEISKKLMISR